MGSKVVMTMFEESRGVVVYSASVVCVARGMGDDDESKVVVI